MSGTAFPTLSEARLKQLLEPPSGPVRLIIDTDTHNEIDDQFTLAWALLSPEAFEIEGTLAAPYSFAHHRAPLLAAFEDLRRDEQADGPEVAIVGSYHRWARNLAAAGTDPREVPFVGPDEGMELSYHEAVKVYELVGAEPDGAVFRGAPGYLTSPMSPLHRTLSIISSSGPCPPMGDRCTSRLSAQ